MLVIISQEVFASTTIPDIHFERTADDCMIHERDRDQSFPSLIDTLWRRHLDHVLVRGYPLFELVTLAIRHSFSQKRWVMVRQIQGKPWLPF